MEAVTLVETASENKNHPSATKSLPKNGTIQNFFKPLGNRSQPRVETPRKRKKKAVLLNTMMAAFIQMKWRSGVSQAVLKNYLITNYQEELAVDVASQTALNAFSRKVSRELKKGVESGIFEKYGRSYKMNKSVRKSICNSVKKMNNSKARATSEKKPKVLSEREKAGLRARVEKEKLLKENGIREGYLSKLTTFNVVPNEVVLSNQNYHFSVTELAKENFIFDFDGDGNLSEEEEKKITFKLNKRQMSRAILIAEFCNFFSCQTCLKLTKFSLSMLIKSLLENRINRLVRETHLALLDLILSPTNLIFLIKNSQYKKDFDFMCRYEKLLLLDLYSILNIATWQEILRRFLVFCLDFNVATSDIEERAEVEEVITLLGDMDYNFLSITQKLIVLEKLVEECNSTLFVREHLQSKINNISLLSKSISGRNREDNKRKKELLMNIKLALEGNGFAVPSSKKRKAKTSPTSEKRKKIEHNKENTVSGSTMGAISKEEQMLKIIIKESVLEDVDVSKEIFAQRLPLEIRSNISKWQREIKAMKPLADERLKEMHLARFWNTVRQHPLGRDAFNNEYYMLRSDLSHLYIYGNNLDLSKNRRCLVEAERHSLQERLIAFDKNARQYANVSSVLDVSKIPPPPPPLASPLSRARKAKKVRLSVVEREAIAKARKENNWGYLDMTTSFMNLASSLNKYDANERELKAELETLFENVISTFPKPPIHENLLDKVKSHTGDTSMGSLQELGGENIEQESSEAEEDANGNNQKSHSTEYIELDKQFKSNAECDSYQEYSNEMMTDFTLSGISVLDFGLDLVKSNLFSALRSLQVWKDMQDVDIEYNFGRLRLSRDLDGGEHSDFLLNWIICELVALAQLLERNGAVLKETHLARMLLEDHMLQFFRANTLKVQTDLTQSETWKEIHLGRLMDFCEVVETRRYTSRRITRQTIIEDSSDEEEGNTTTHFSMFRVIEEIEDLYELAPEEEGEASSDKEMSSSTLSERCIRSLIDLLLVIENVSCSLYSVKQLSLIPYFDNDSESEDSLDEEDASEKKSKEVDNKQDIAKLVSSYLKQYEVTSSEVKFDPVLVGESLLDVVGFSHSAFTRTSKGKSVDDAFYKLSRRQPSIEKVKLGDLVERLNSLEQISVTEEDMLEGMALAEEEGHSTKLLSSNVRKEFEKTQSYYRRLWGYSVKRELWLESLKILLEVRSVSAACVAVAQLSAAIYNNRTKQVFLKKIPRRNCVPIIDASVD